MYETLYVGEYAASAAFRKIEHHACVVDDDGRLIAVTGRADDADAIACATLFAQAPRMLAALRAFVEPWSCGGDWEHKINYDTYNNARMAIEAVEAGLR